MSAEEEGSERGGGAVHKAAWSWGEGGGHDCKISRPKAAHADDERSPPSPPTER